MSAYAFPILFTLLLWWISTGVILYLDGLNRRTFALSMAAATALLGVSFWGASATAANTTTNGAYLAFACGLTVWGWQLVSFYMGYLTGPQKTACAPDVTGFRRFLAGAGAMLYHELAICVGAALLVFITRGYANQMAVWTYLVLWWMHLSAKLNIFFGVPNLGEELLPQHLRYLRSFMARKPMNLLFPLSVTASTVLTVLLTQKAIAADATPFETAGFTMLATLMALAIAEHWLLVVPLPGNALWKFGIKSDANDGEGSRIVAASDLAGDGHKEPTPAHLKMKEASSGGWLADEPKSVDTKGLRTTRGLQSEASASS